MNRNSLLKEHVAEIDRLRSDLLAVREKNGIYFSEESWNQMNLENELRRTELVEAKKQVTIVENQLRNVRDEFDQSIALLKQKEQELHSTRNQLQQREETLQQREAELRYAVNAYDEEVVVCQAHQETEITLNNVALGLKGVAAQGLRDIQALFEKLGICAFFSFTGFAF
jgi:kinesin family protein 11